MSYVRTRDPRVSDAAMDTVHVPRVGRGRRGPKEHQSAWGAAVWGLAEATLFFIVPDVFLSWVALTRPARALRACLWAVGGALVGGTLMYLWGTADPAGARAALDMVPAVSSAEIAGVASDLREHSWWALVLGPLTGTPYKIYAVEAGALGMSLGALLLVSVPARLVRFLVVTLLAAGLARAPGLRRLSPISLSALHATFWIAFYAAFWQVKGW